MSSVTGGNQDVDIDLGGLFSAVWLRRRRILGITVLAAGVAFAGSMMLTPSYRGEARLLIESRSPNLSAAEGPASGNDPVLDSLNITSQAELLQSADLIKQVARDLKLYQLEEFDPDRNSLLPDPLVLLGLKANPMDLAPEERVIKTFREKLEVYAVENSRVIAIEFSSEDPKLAAAIPNKMADVYLSLQSGAKLDTHSETARWLEPEIASLTEKVREAERKVADYRASAGLFQTTDTVSFSAQQLNDISAELARVRGERANAEAKAENVRAALKAGKDPDTLAEVVGSQVIQRLKEAEANLQAQISDQATSLLESHPRLKGLRAQLGGIRGQIASETRKILSSLENEAEGSRIRERQLMQQLNGLKADSAKAGEEEVGLRALEREAAAQRQLLETYLSRYREAASRLDGNSSPADARVVSNAVEPAEPYFPKVIPITIVAALVTFIISAIAVMIGELFSGRALKASVAERPIEEAAEVPEPQLSPAAGFRRQEPEAVEDQEGEPAPEAVPAPKADDSFRMESVIRYLMHREVPIAIGISPTGDEGSTATVTLAREIAGRDRSAIVLDLTGSACPTRLMADGSQLPGITDLLCGEAAFGEVIHPDRVSDAHIIPQGTADPGRAMQGLDRLSMIIDALADAYDLVLVECGAAGPEALSSLPRTDAAEIILSLPGMDDEGIAEFVSGFTAAGFDNLLVLSDAGSVGRPEPRRRARAA